MKYLWKARSVAFILLLLPVAFWAGCNGDDDQFPGGGRVTEVQIGVDNANFSGTCPHTFAFNGVITTNGAGTITYFWERSNGQNTQPQNVGLPVPGALVVTNDFVVSASGSTTVRLVITRPNDIQSNAITVTAVCQ